MTGTEPIGYVILAARVLSLAAIMPLLKAYNKGQDHVAATFLFCLLGTAWLLPPVIYEALSRPDYFANIGGWLDNSIISAVLFTFGMIVFMWALGRGDVNLLAPLMSLVLVFIYILDIVRGVVSPSLLPISGIALVMFGVAVLNIGPGVRLQQALNPLLVLRQPGAIGAVVYALTLAIVRIVDSAGVEQAPEFLYAFSGSLFVAIICGVILAFRHKLSAVGTIWRQVRMLAVITSLVGTASYVTLLGCYAYFIPSAIEPPSQLAIVITVLAGTVIFKEPLRLRWLAALLVTVGAIIVLIYR